jgi:hypothetical protein
MSKYIEGQAVDPALFSGDDIIIVVEEATGRDTYSTINALRTLLDTLPIVGGTANGVAYLNGSKVLTSGSALTFDGSNLGIGTSSPSVKLDVQGGSINTSSWVSITPSVATNNAIYRSINTGGTFYSGIDSSIGAVTGTGYAGMLWHTGAYPIAFGTNGALKMTLDSSGNLGLGVTPSAWGGVYAGALQVGRAVMHTNTGDFRASFGQNYYVDGTNARYIGDGFATQLMQVSGDFRFFTAPNNTSGAGAGPISFTQAMTLDASSRLLVHTTSAGVSDNGNTRLTVGGASATTYQSIKTSGGEEIIIGTTAGSTFIGSFSNNLFEFRTNNTERARIPAAGGVVVGTAALATNATDGFLYVPTCAGTPTGTPTTQTGTAPIVVDTTNNKLYFYSGGQWRDAGP